MLISVIGNIASGKSAFIRNFKKRLPDYSVLSIDDYRKRHNQEGTKVGEMKAWAYLQQRVSERENIILETSGIGSKYHSTILKYSGVVVTVFINTEWDVCIMNHRRRMEKGYKLPPMPWTSDVENSIKEMDTLYQGIECDFEISNKEDIEGIIELIPF